MEFPKKIKEEAEKNIFRSHVQKFSKCDENCKPKDPRNRINPKHRKYEVQSHVNQIAQISNKEKILKAAMKKRLTVYTEQR